MSESRDRLGVPLGRWAVRTIGGEDGASWKTVFVSGVQAFTLVSLSHDEPEARETCEWYARMFRTAMATLGAPPEWIDPAAERDEAT